MAPVLGTLFLTSWMLLLLQRAPGAGAQETGQGFKVEQPQDKVVVTAGGMINLTCTVSGDKTIIGPVRWLKGWGSGNETVYAETGSFPRVTRAVSVSSTDFSISISNAQPQDSGTYYCVKFRRTVTGVEVFQRGKGTVVSVHGVNVLSSPVLWIGILLEKGLLGGLLLFLFKRGGA